MALLILYGSLACLALWLAWADGDLRWVGGAVMTNFVGSNLTWFLFPASGRPGPYSMLEMFVMVSAFMAWDIRRSRLDTRDRHADFLLVIVVAVALLSVCANVGLAVVGPYPIWAQIHLHEWATNLCFAAECLLVSAVGVIDGFRIGRFASRRHLGRASAERRIVRDRAAGEAE